MVLLASLLICLLIEQAVSHKLLAASRKYKSFFMNVQLMNEVMQLKSATQMELNRTTVDDQIITSP